MLESSRKIVFVCVGNSVRSQMAEAYLRAEGPGDWEVMSAGIYPSSIHPLTKKVLEEDGLLLGEQAAKGFSAIGPKPDCVIVLASEVLSHAQNYFEACEILFWPIPDPSMGSVDLDDEVNGFRRIRDEIRKRVRKLLKA